MIAPFVREHLRQHTEQAVINAVGIMFVVAMLLTIVATSSSVTIQHSRFANAVKGMITALAWSGAIAAVLLLAVNRVAQVKDRTREFAILGMLGGSFGYIADLLLQETICVASPGVVAGIVLAQVNDLLMASFFHGLLSVKTPYLFWLPAGVIAVMCFFTAGLVGARSGMQLDVLEALGYES